jgi:hypothetical protein
MSPDRRRLDRREFAEFGLALGTTLLSGCAVDALETPAVSGAGGHGGTGGAGAGGAGGTPGGAGSGISISSGGSAASGGAPPGTPSPESGLSSLPLGSAPSASTCGGASGGLFCDEIVWNQIPARRVLYSWTTAEQLEELRTDPVLLTRTEQAGLGRGYAFTSIDELAARGSAPENQLLSQLGNELFQEARYAWPSPWATRMGFPGEDYGDRLVEITLKPEALIVVVRDMVGMAVIDLQNQIVPVEDALGQLERIGAVYFLRTEIAGSGTFRSCSGGYREFIVGNEAMVERWAIETEDMRARIEADAARIDGFLELLRGSVPAVNPATFADQVACQWDYGAASEVDIYYRALALASELYLPRPAELTSISETLRQSLFEPNPLIVEPGG